MSIAFDVTRFETRLVEETFDESATTDSDRMCGGGPPESECSRDGACRREPINRRHPQGTVAAPVLQRLRLPGVLVRSRHRRRWWIRLRAWPEERRRARGQTRIWRGHGGEQDRRAATESERRPDSLGDVLQDLPRSIPVPLRARRGALVGPSARTWRPLQPVRRRLSWYGARRGLSDSHHRQERAGHAARCRG